MLIRFMLGVVELPAVIGSSSEYVCSERIGIGAIDRDSVVPGLLDKEDIRIRCLKERMKEGTLLVNVDRYDFEWVYTH